MKSPIKPLSPRAIRVAVITRWVWMVGLIGLTVLLVMRSDTLYLQSEQADGKVYVRVELEVELNDLPSMMKGDGLWVKHVNEITVFHSKRMGAWVTRDEDLEKIGGRVLRRMLGDGSISINGGRLVLSTDGNPNSETTIAVIDFPDRKHRVTKLDYSSSAFDQTFDLEWEERARR